jgi:Secretion system C-terminal sorting domain
MKKIYCLFLTFIATVSYSQIVAIPDANFKAKLLAANTTNLIAYDASGNPMRIDTNLDNQIQVAEALLVGKLYIPDANVSNLQGIESFTNLTFLDCSSNNLTALNLSALVNLQIVHCFTNQLGALNVSGLNQLEFLDCSFNQLTALDTSGLISLDFLWADDNQLVSLNLAGMTNLTKLYVAQNNLASLDLSPVVNLVELYCRENNLTTLDFAGLIHLETLACQDNQLTQLNLANLPALKTLEAYWNNLSALSISNLPAIGFVNVFGNQLTTLDTQNLPALESLYCAENQLTMLDFSTCPNFRYLQCRDNNLLSINLKNGRDLDLVSGTGFMNWSNNPLVFVCIDDTEAAAVQQALTASSLNGVNINTYCSFSPGGNYNTISGQMALDVNNNGCDSSESLGEFIKLRMLDGLNSSYSFTNDSGQYRFFTGTGTFAVYPDVENVTYFNISPPVALATFPLLDNSVQTQDFCLTPNGVHPDLEVVLVPIRSPRPGFDAIYDIVYKNKGNQVLSGNLNLVFQDNVLDYVTAIPAADNVTVNTLSWNYSNLRPFENRKIRCTLNVNSPQESPAVNSGDLLDFAISISPTASDETPLDNFFSLHQLVVNSLDPNDKICLEGTTVSPETIGNYLHYTINFENTGTAAAQNIVVKDLIDTEKFDISTLQVLGASHPMQAKITGNKVEFIYEGIQLGAGEHGYVAFKIKTKSTLAVGSSVANQADIFFDYNFPVVTDPAVTTFQVLGVEDFKIDQSVSIVPNPATDFVTVKANSEIQSVTLFDVQGRSLMTQLSTGFQVKLDTATYPKGVYLIKVETVRGSRTEKMILK